MGYSRVGFDEIVGVDNRPQKNYPFEFIQAHALEYLAEHGHEFDVIHTSPPCQGFTTLKSMRNARVYLDLIAPTRNLLEQQGKPYVIENVPGAPLKLPIKLCGAAFKLGCETAELRRHRLFEIRPWLPLPARCNHGWKESTVAVDGHSGGSSTREKARVIGVNGGHGRDRRRRANTQGFSTQQRREAMGIDWMTGDELSQAIPPAYTEYIGKELLRQL